MILLIINTLNYLLNKSYWELFRSWKDQLGLKVRVSTKEFPNMEFTYDCFVQHVGHVIDRNDFDFSVKNRPLAQI